MAQIRNDDLIEYLLRLGDSTLVLGQRLSEWCGHAPAIEEDIALTNTALDLIGQARQLLTYAGELEGRGRDEDALAFLRDELEFRNVTLAEVDGGDFGRTVLRVFLFAAQQVAQWQALLGSSDARLAAIAEKSIKESRYHLRYAADWVVRLGDGTDESRRRMQDALDFLWPLVAELFESDAVEARLEGVAPASADLRDAWERLVLPVLAEATLKVPAEAVYTTRGKYGVHSEALGPLLAEMQFLQRAYPGGNW
ncbi:1,2-phenylacetyl-CoA epoxidase subunit PaaC [Crenobacter luteus]|uniref:Phenylacetic acid degradation protein n=1 Tax=Crenobacter luteus TaxID=1452487 RepID=A0A161S4Q9_9NEIS|nr:1,2-phenylacetyl-CoA epoxidase subunit PaaC [Crenobacter luteus]KZE27325.1 phenylacetic acid degradation protein [Crenobacter luteus]